VFPEQPSSRRKRRRRSRFLLPILLAVVFLAFWAADRSANDNLISTAFYDDVRSVAASQSLAASDFERMLITSAALDRAQYIALMDQLQSGVDQGIIQVSSDEVQLDDIPDRIIAVQSLAAETLTLWADGLELFEEASLAIVDDPLDSLAIIHLGDALAKIKTGDVLYEILALETDALRIDLALSESPMPSVTFLPAIAITPSFVAALVSRFANSTGLVGVPGFSIATVTTIPEATGGQEGNAARLPFTDVLEVQVVVSNNGNVPETDLSVLLRIHDVATNIRVLETQQIAVLEMGGQTTVRFSDLEVFGGESYTITVEVATDGQGADAPEPFVYEIFIAHEALSVITTVAL
jgi:hypothetical protein